MNIALLFTTDTKRHCRCNHTRVTAMSTILC